jgi:hypothetical protein
VVSQDDAVDTFKAHVRRYGRLLYYRYRQIAYPIVTMVWQDDVWTSICLVLRKR